VVEPLDRSDVDAAGVTLARAFRDNPGMLAILRDPSPDMRLKLLVPFMRCVVAGVQRYGTAEVVREGGRVVGVALSFAPGTFPPPFRFQLVAGRGLVRGGPARLIRVLRVDGWMRKRHLHDPHFYLMMLGVDPDQQGKGHGGALVRALSARADAAQMPCYLETDKESNIRVYENHGYRVTSDADAPLPDLHLWFMQRPLQRNPD
jgi:ribosomal protein S18 acetylase RimI-like enzyme